jgi:hypothetical protein
MYPCILDVNVFNNLDQKTLEVINNSKSDNELINNLLKIIVTRGGLKSKEEILKQYNYFSKRTFDDLVRANKIPHYRVNNKTILFNPIEISDYFDSNYKVGA